MILPILSYGHEILSRACKPVTNDEDGLEKFVRDMWETMYNAKGCGLAAPQVNRSLQLFIVDSKSTFEALKPEERIYLFGNNDEGIVETFINAKITGSSNETWEDEEGCLSIPKLSRPVIRPVSITMEYLDAAFKPQSRSFSGITARMIQHEYDHTCGKLYLDYLNPLMRKLLEGKLQKIASGLIPARYPMQYVAK